MTVRRPPFAVGGALSSVGLVGAVVLTGCTGDGDGGGSAAPPPASTTAAVPAPSTTPGPPPYELPTSCGALLTLSQIDEALGSTLPGETTFTVGTPEPAIDRTGRITCGFGVVPASDVAGAGPPLLELSVFTYTDATAAADRVEATVAAQQSRGVRSEPATVPGADAVLLTGPDGATLVATVAARTYSLSIVPGILDATATPPALTQLAGQVVVADGGPVSTGSTAPTG